MPMCDSGIDVDTYWCFGSKPISANVGVYT